MCLHLKQRDRNDTQLRRLDLAKLRAERSKKATGKRTKARTSQESLISNVRSMSIYGGQFNFIRGQYRDAMNSDRLSLPSGILSPPLMDSPPTLESVTNHRPQDHVMDPPGNWNNPRRSPALDNKRDSMPMWDLPVRLDDDIYYRHMFAEGRGIPMRLPEPSVTLPREYQRRGIAIGDVGILTEFGGFDFMFNICLPADDPIHRQGLPEGFSPLFPPLSPSDIYRHKEFKSNSYLASASVKSSRRENDSSAITFASSDSEGAILTLPHGAYTENLANVLRFRHYLSTHLESFYKYVINKRGRKVRNGDVRLVIGCVKASSWGMATFLDSTASDFYLKFKVTSESRLMQAYGWEHSGLVEAKAGPDPEETEELRSSDNSVHSRKYNNQCLFLSTTNAKLGDEVWQRLAFGFEMPMDQSESYSNPSSFSSSAPPHPSKAMNDFILSANPQARIAIIEDEDWTSLIAKTDRRLPPPEELIRRMLTTYDVCESDGVVFLRLKQENKHRNVISQQLDQSINVPLP